MVKLKQRAILALLSFATMIFILIFASAGDVMSIEANIIVNGTDDGGGEEIRVQVPDYIYLGDINSKGFSQELKIYVNNTGNVDITVTPRLINSSERIFENLFFRKYKTSNGTAVPFSRIGDFSFNIAKPSTGSNYNDEYFYMMLDLRNSTLNIDKTIIGHRADVKFFAIKKV